MTDVPVALFAYARADHLRDTLAALRANRVPRLWAFSDAPRSPADAPAVAEVRAVLRGVDWCDVTLIEADENLGLGRSIRSGVDRVLRAHEAVIVCEDDLVCVPGTYDYLVAALRHYRDDERVMSVTGWTHPTVVPKRVTDGGDAPYFDGKAECWTWGTWRRGWSGMEVDALALLGACRDRGIDVERYGSDLPKMAAEEGMNNLWAVRWWYLHLLRSGLCLRPPRSMVEHLGFDRRATTSAGATRWANPPLGPRPPIPSRWPEPVEEADCARLWRQSVGDPV